MSDLKKKPELSYTSGGWIQNEKGEPTGFKMEFNTKEALLFYLSLYLKNKETPEGNKPEIQEALSYLSEHLEKITLKPGKRIKVTFDYLPAEEEVRDKIGFYLSTHYVRVIIYGLLQMEERAKKPKKPGKKGKLRSGANLIDNILKVNRPTQLTIWDGLLKETQDKILRSGANIEYVNRKGEGIKLSKGEYRLLLCLTKLLHEKSQTNDKKGEDYYTGNMGTDIIKWETQRGAVEVKMPKIGFTLYEITKEFYGEETIGGENVNQVKELLDQLAYNPDKKALMRYTRTVALDKGIIREYFIERYDSLISMLTAGWKDILNGKQIDEKREIVVGLHPIFIDQIADKYIELPLDLTKRLIEASGSPNISEITTKLILELYRAHSNRKKLPKDQAGNPIYQISQEKLFYKIAESYMPPNRKRIPLIKNYLDKSIETAKEIGLLFSYEIKPGTEGDNIYHFTLLKNWQ